MIKIRWVIATDLILNDDHGHGMNWEGHTTLDISESQGSCCINTRSSLSRLMILLRHDDLKCWSFDI